MAPPINYQEFLQDTQAVIKKYKQQRKRYERMADAYQKKAKQMADRIADYERQEERIKRELENA